MIDGSSRIAERPRLFWAAGQELLAWRREGELRVAPNSCPHMGAPLSAGRCEDGMLVCPWHGLRLGGNGHGAWRPLPAHDDGVLCWVRLGAEDPAHPLPVLPVRPRPALVAVNRMVARCRPEDVIANRLDPWHGTHLHFHSFARLRVLEATEERVRLRVVFRIAGPAGVEVEATFHCPEPRTIVMTIVAGEGVGSVVETHATPLEPGWTAITEAVLASSDRAGFRLARVLGRRWLELLLGLTARRLWVEDAAYCERVAHLREPRGVTREAEGGWRRAVGTPRWR